MSDPFSDMEGSGRNYESTSMSCSVKVLSLLATLLGWLGGLIIFFLEKQNVYVRAVALQSLIINAATFIVVCIFLITCWIHTFFLVMLILTLLVHIAIIIALAVLAYIKADSGVFFGIPPLGGWILSVANH